MAEVSIVTPWLNGSELCRVYERSNAGAQVVVVDNGSDLEHAARIEAMVERMGGVYICNPHNAGFSGGNNQGYAHAVHDVVMFLSNDTEAPPGWVDNVPADVGGDGLYGPRLLTTVVDAWTIPYLEGFCVAARRSVWDALGCWDADNYPGIYWEDNDLSFRATQAGFKLHQTRWPVFHQGNYTTSKMEGGYRHVTHNREFFFDRVRQAWAVAA